MSEPLIFEMSRHGRRGVSLPEVDVPAEAPEQLLGAELVAEASPALPEVAVRDVVAHFTRLSRRNLMSVDANFYPLGSCTMKYNPRVNEMLAALPGFAHPHPYASEFAPGLLELMAGLSQFLCEITGMDAASLQPAAGAHGEFTALLVIQAHYRERGEKRRIALIPDIAHGTNPASCTLAGLEVREVKSGPDGLVDMKSLREQITDDVAVLMITNPNTLGLFEKNIRDIADALHERGAMLYLDGANMNAIMGIARPGDFGVDVMHLNLHKTFSAPHGGGGPGAGPITVTKALAPYLPAPVISRDASGSAFLDDERPKSIGKVRTFYGNVGVMVRAYAYILSLGSQGLKEVSEMAVLNANYLSAKLSAKFSMPYGKRCMHEFVATGKPFAARGVKTLDIAKRLIDAGVHPPTVYFPLIVKEAMMIEPTETESKETLDAFVDIMFRIADEIEESPEVVAGAPVTAPVSRLDEVTAARRPKLTWEG